MSEKRLYVRVRGKVLGPFAIEQLKSMRDRGQFRRFHEVSEDRQRWVSAASMSDIFPATKAENRSRKDEEEGDGESYKVMLETSDATQKAANPPEAVAEWYYIGAGEKQVGPVSRDRLQTLLEKDTVSRETLVWKPGMDRWVELGSAAAGICAAPVEPNEVEVEGSDQDQARPDGMKALGVFFTDPVGGLAPLCETIGPVYSLILGFCFCLVFDFCLLLMVLLLREHVMDDLGPFAANRPTLNDQARIAILKKVAVLSLLPLLTLAGSIAVIRVITGSKGHLGFDFLTAGAVLLPLGPPWPIAVLLGGANVEVVLFLFTVCGCLSILVLNSAFTRVVKLSDRGAILAIPATLVLNCWLWKIAILSPMFLTP
jgi:hypothetical protein